MSSYRRNRSSVWPLVIIGVTILLVAGGAAAIFLGIGPFASVLPPMGHQAVIRDYVQKNLNDTDGLEFVEWGEPYQPKQKPGVTAVRVKIRSKTIMGSRALREYLFFVKDDKVIGREDVTGSRP